MNNTHKMRAPRPLSLMVALTVMVAAGCGSGRSDVPIGDASTVSLGAGSSALVLPYLAPAGLASGDMLRVLATTSILGDVIAQVGGDAIELTTLMKPGQDPHAYQPSARDLTAVSEAHVIMVNGWNLEQSLVDDLKNVAGSVPIVPISAGITPRAYADGIDPHVWLNPAHVVKWVENISTVLATLDPAHEDGFRRNADAYLAQLGRLVEYAKEQIATIPQEKRILVTNHDSLGYFADEYGFDIMGTVIPSADTLAEPSALGLSLLVDQMAAAGICAIYAETTASQSLAEAAAAELDECPLVQIVTLHTGALGLAGSGAADYLSMMRANIDAIVAGQNSE